MTFKTQRGKQRPQASTSIDSKLQHLNEQDPHQQDAESYAEDVLGYFRLTREQIDSSVDKRFFAASRFKIALERYEFDCIRDKLEGHPDLYLNVLEELVRCMLAERRLISDSKLQGKNTDDWFTGYDLRWTPIHYAIQDLFEHHKEASGEPSFLAKRFRAGHGARISHILEISQSCLFGGEYDTNLIDLTRNFLNDLR